MTNFQQIKQVVSMVIEDTCDILNIKPIRFEFADIGSNSAESRSAVYLSKEEALSVGRKYELIVIDKKYATSCHELELISTIAHEVRHAYQKRHPQEYSFQNYKRAYKEGLIEYATQLIEVDAIAFSEVYLILLTGKKLSLNLPPEVRKEVDSRKETIIKSLQL